MRVSQNNVNMTSDEINSEINKISSLQFKLVHGGVGGFLDDDERELIDAVMTRHQAEIYEEWKYNQLVDVISILFPKYHWNLPDKDKPVRWPAKEWWWNGAAITEHYEASDGGFIVNLSSYTGGGNSDELDNFHIPLEWIEADNKKEYLQSICAGMNKLKK